MGMAKSFRTRNPGGIVFEFIGDISESSQIILTSFTFFTIWIVTAVLPIEGMEKECNLLPYVEYNCLLKKIGLILEVGTGEIMKTTIILGCRNGITASRMASQRSASLLALLAFLITCCRFTDGAADITIGGSIPGHENIPAARVVQALGSGDVLIQATRSIRVDEDINSTSVSTLTLQAPIVEVEAKINIQGALKIISPLRNSLHSDVKAAEVDIATDAVSTDLCQYKTLSSSSPASENYLGCYHDDPTSRALSSTSMVDPNMSPFMCINFCKAGGHAYAGVQAGDKCFCGGTTYNVYGLSNGCTRPCGESIENTRLTCGGWQSSDVYKTSSATSSLLSTRSSTTTGMQVDGVVLSSSAKTSIVVYADYVSYGIAKLNFASNPPVESGNYKWNSASSFSNVAAVSIDSLPGGYYVVFHHACGQNPCLGGQLLRASILQEASTSFTQRAYLNVRTAVGAGILLDSCYFKGDVNSGIHILAMWTDDKDKTWVARLLYDFDGTSHTFTNVEVKKMVDYRVYDVNIVGLDGGRALASYFDKQTKRVHLRVVYDKDGALEFGAVHDVLPSKGPFGVMGSNKALVALDETRVVLAVNENAAGRAYLFSTTDTVVMTDHNIQFDVDSATKVTFGKIDSCHLVMAYVIDNMGTASYATSRSNQLTIGAANFSVVNQPQYNSLEPYTSAVLTAHSQSNVGFSYVGSDKKFKHERRSWASQDTLAKLYSTATTSLRGPSTFEANGDINMPLPITLSGTSKYYMAADADTSGAGKLALSTVSIGSSIQEFQILGAALDLSTINGPTADIIVGCTLQMKIGNALSGAGCHLSYAELSGITTTRRLGLGNSLGGDVILGNQVSSNVGNAEHLWISSGLNILFESGSVSPYTLSVYAHAKNHVTLSHSMTNTGLFAVVADSDCNGAGNFIQNSPVSAKNMSMYAADVTFGASISVTDMYVGACKFRNIALGGSGSTLTGSLLINKQEMSRFATTSFTVATSRAEVTMMDMTATAAGDFNIISGGDLTVKASKKASFKTLSVYTNYSANLEQSSELTTTGDMKFDLNEAPARTVTMNKLSKLTSAAKLTFDGHSSSILNMGENTTASAKSDFDIDFPVNLIGSGSATIIADSDLNNAGTLIFKSTAPVTTIGTTKDHFTLQGADLQLSAAIKTSQAHLTVRTLAGKLWLGSNPSTGMKISQAELNFLETTGTLKLRSKFDVTVDAYNQVKTPAETQILSDLDIIFKNGGSRFITKFSALANDDVKVETAVTGSGAGDFFLFGDADCNSIGNFELKPSGSVTTTNRRLTIHGFPTLQGTINTGTETIVFSGCFGTHIDVGGDGTTTTGGIKITRADLQRITSSNLTIHAKGGNVYQYDTIASDTASIAGRIKLIGDSQVQYKGSAVYKSLYSKAPTTSIAGDIKVNEGHLLLESTSYTVEDTAYITSEVKNIYVNPIGSGTGSMTTKAGATWKSATDITFEVPITVTGSGTLAFHSDFDEDADGEIVIPSTSGITVSATSVDQLLFTGADITVNSNIQGNQANVTIMTSNYTSSQLSVGSNNGGMHLSDAELDRITTASKITLGSLQTDKVTVNGVSSSHTANEVLIVSHGDVVSQGASSAFSTKINIIADKNIDITESVTVTGGSITATADRDCNFVGNFKVRSGKTFKAVNNPIDVKAYDVQLDGLLNSGTKPTKFFGCSGINIDVGGSQSTPGHMKVNQAELQRITATNLTFNGVNAEISVYKTVSADTANVADRVFLDAGAKINFKQSNIWKSLETNTATTNINADIKVTDNHLVMESAIYNVADAVYVTSEKENIYIEPRSGGTTGTMNAAPSTFRSAGDLAFEVPVTVSGSGNMFFQADKDADADGTLSFSAASGITSTGGGVAQIELSGHDLILESAISAGTTNVSIETSNYTNSILSVGATASGLHLSDTELDRITTTSSLTLGSKQTETVIVNGASYTGATQPQDVYIIAEKDVKFQTSGSSFKTRLGVYADNNIDVETSVTVNNGDVKMVTDADCNAAGIFTVKSTGSITTNNKKLTIQARDISLLGTTNSGTEMTGILGCAGVSIDVGFDGSTTTGQIRVSQAELQKITAANLSFSAPFGDIFVYDTVAADTANVANQVQMFSSLTGKIEVKKANEWKSLYAVTPTMTINGDMKTTVSHMVLEATNYNVESGVFIVSDGGNIYVEPRTGAPGTMQTKSPVHFKGKQDVTFEVPMFASGTGGVYIDADSDGDGSGTLSFNSASPISLSPSNSIIRLTAADLILGASLTAVNSNVTILNSPSSGAKMSVGTTTTGGLHVDNTELNRITTNKSLTFGSLKTHFLTFNGANHLKSNPEHVYAISVDDVIFKGTTSKFLTQFSSYANDDVIVEALLEVDGGEVVLVADADCNRDGIFNLKAGGVVKTNDRKLTIQGPPTLTGTINTGTAQVVFTTCAGYDIDVGSDGTTTTGYIKITQSDLQKITAINTTIYARAASIYQYKTVVTDTSGVTGRVNLVADKTLSFRESSIYKTLRGSAPKVNITGDIKVTESHLVLESTRYDVFEGSYIQSEAQNVYVRPLPGLTGSMWTQAGVFWKSATDLSFEVPLKVVGSGTIDFQTDSDEDTKGTLSFSPQASITVDSLTVKQLRFTAADMIVNAAVQAKQANISIQVSNSTNSVMSVGSNHGGLHLSDAELDRLTTTSQLTLGSEQTDYVVLDGATYAVSPDDVFVVASVNATFIGAASSFVTRLGVHAGDEIKVDAKVTVTGGVAKFVADQGCVGRNGMFMVTPLGEITANRPTYVQAYDVMLSGKIDSGSHALHFISCSGSIDVGGTGTTTTGQMRVSQAELGLLTSTNLTFTSVGHRVHIYKTVLSDTSTVAGRVTFNGKTDVEFADSSIWKSALALSPKINISADLKVTESHLIFEGTEYYVHAGVYVQSESKNIYVEDTAGGTGKMVSETPVTWKSASDLTFEVPIKVKGMGSLMFDADFDEDKSGTLSFDSTASVSVIESGVQQIVLTGADLILEAELQARQANITVQVSNHSTSKLSVGANNGGMHVSNAELARIKSDTSVMFGSTQTDIVVVDGATYSHTPADLYFVSMDQIEFKTGASNFATRVGVHADKDIKVGAAVTTTGGTMTWVANANCGTTAGSGTFTKTASGSITTTDNTMWIEAYDVVLTANGKIDTGTAALHFVGCGVSIDVGGTGTTTTGQMRLSRAELQLLKSTNLTFSSVAGAVSVYNTLATDTTDVLNRVTFNAFTKVDFLGSSIFKSVRAAAPSINIKDDMKVTEGHLVLEAQNYVVDGGIWIQSEVNNIYVEPPKGGTGSMTTSTPVTWKAAEDLTFEVPISITGTAGAMFEADGDEDKSGTVSFNNVATVSVTGGGVDHVKITGADLFLEANLNAAQANVTIQVSNHTDSTLSIGANHGGMHLTNTELNRITTTTSLNLGSTQTDHVFVNGVTHTKSPTEVNILSMLMTKFRGAGSTFQTKFSVLSDKDIDVDVPLTVSNGPVRMIANADCGSPLAGGNFIKMGTGSIQTNNQVLTIQGHDVVMAGPGELTSGTRATHFISCTGSIDVGGTGATTTGSMRVSAAELRLLNSVNLTFNAQNTGKKVNVYDTVITDTTDVLSRVDFHGNAEVNFLGTSVWKSARATAPAINIKNDIKVTESHLIFESSAYTVDAGVYVQSETRNIYVEPPPGQTGTMLSQTPVKWKSAEDITFEVPISVIGGGELFIQSDSDEDASGNVVFNAAADVTVTGSSVQSIELIGADIQLNSRITANSANVTVHPSNYTGNVLSVGSVSHGGMHLSDAELDRITTTSQLQLGSTQTDNVWLHGVSHADTPEFVYVVADTHIEVAGTSSFSTNTEMRADEDIKVKSSLTVSGGTLQLKAEANCNNTGNLIVTAAGTVKVVDNTLKIVAKDVDIKGIIDTGAAATHFVAGCAGQGVDVGGDGTTTTSTMRIDRSELAKITSTNLSITSASHHIRVYDTIFADTAAVSGIVFLDAHTDMDFIGSTVFKSVDSNAPKTNISNDIKVTEGHLVMEANDFHVDAGVHVQSETKNIYIEALGSSGIIRSDSPVTWKSAGDITFEVPMNLYGSGSLNMYADSDFDADGTISISNSGGITVVDYGILAITMDAADFVIDATVEALAANVTIGTSNYTNSKLSVGTSHGGAHITDAELDRIKTDSLIRIGSMQTEFVYIDGISHTDTPVNVEVYAEKDITFIGAGSSFVRRFHACAMNDLNIFADLTLSNGNVSLKADCDCNTVGTFNLTAGHTLNTNNEKLETAAPWYDIKGDIIAGSTETLFSSCYGLHIDIGGDGTTTTGDIKFPQPVLNKITGNNVTFRASGGNIYVYQVDVATSDQLDGFTSLRTDAEINVNDSSTWKSIILQAPEINVNGHIRTYESHMILRSSEYNVQPGSWIQSDKGNIYVRLYDSMLPGNPANMTLHTPTQFRGANDISFEVPVFVVGVDNWFVQADSDEDAAGTVSFAEEVKVTESPVESIVIIGADIIIDAPFDAMGANVTIQVSNYTGSTLSVGQNFGGMHLSDAEIDRIRTDTSLMLGSLQTDKVFVGGVSYTDTPADLYFVSHDLIEFKGTASSFTTRVGVHAENHVNVKTPVTVSGGTFTVVANAKCSSATSAGKFTLTGSGDIKTTDNVMWIQAYDVVLTGPGKLDTGNAALHFRGMWCFLLTLAEPAPNPRDRCM
eukprot:jgi/Bigna1/144719/aug1.90_g19427